MSAALLAASLAAALGVNPQASAPFAPTPADHAPGSCHIRYAANGMSLPDPACTPGAINPTVTAAVLRDPRWRTGLVRDKATSADQKRRVYTWYGITPPAHNTGGGQVCELDHLDPLIDGGADTLDNVWPQCGPASVPVGQRWFKVKDARAELVVHREVLAAPAAQAQAVLEDGQRRMAQDFTQFLPPEGQGEAGTTR